MNKRIPSVLALSAVLAAFAAHAADDSVTMYKDPNCGCCSKWASHLRDNGFTVQEVKSTEMSRIKHEAGVPQKLASCHTARVGGYVIEGHVPAADIRRLLKEKPAVAGLSAPGMPASSPGMDVPGVQHPYDVIAFDKDGGQRVYARH